MQNPSEPQTVGLKERRERILSFARFELSQRGYDDMNMRDLADLVGVSTATLYQLYESKDVLILAALQELMEGIESKAAKPGIRGFERFVQRTELIASQIMETQEYAKAISIILFNAEPDDPMIHALLGSAIDRHLVELEEMQTDGQLRADVDHAFQARRLTSAYWIVILLWTKGLLPTSEFKIEYRRTALLTMLPCVNDEMAEKLRNMMKLL